MRFISNIQETSNLLCIKYHIYIASEQIHLTLVSPWEFPPSQTVYDYNIYQIQLLA